MCGVNCKFLYQNKPEFLLGLVNSLNENLLKMEQNGGEKMYPAYAMEWVFGEHKKRSKMKKGLIYQV